MDDEQIGLEAAFRFEARLKFGQERSTQTVPAVFRQDGEMIDQPAPPIKAADDRTDNFSLFFNDEEKIGIVGELLSNFFPCI